MLSQAVCQKARLTRDPRFDGQFFIAVKTTKVYCRNVCKVAPPLEKNVSYYASAIAAANAGYRPCLKCRPDSAPGSPLRQGANTTIARAIKLIEQGVLQHNKVNQLAEKLGISERHLHALFKQHLGVSVKQYAQYQQCLFAKQLLHSSGLSITEVAFASGFNSIRRFNDCMQKNLKLTPTQIRTNKKASQTLTIELAFRPPYNFALVHQFLSSRAIVGLETVTPTSYRRNFIIEGEKGAFCAEFIAAKNCFNLTIELNQLSLLPRVLANIRRLLDLDANMLQIQDDLKPCLTNPESLVEGLRLIGIWHEFEAGVRAILGQQVSVQAARKLVQQLVDELGERDGEKRYFPTPEAVLANDLAFFKMPQSRKNTLHNLAAHFCHHPSPLTLDLWLNIKGIGPWTVNYAKMRGQSNPDIFLDGDLGVKKARSHLVENFTAEQAAPWGSYLTLQLWHLL